MSDEDDGRVALLGEAQDGGGAFPYLRDAAGGGLQCFGGDGLYGVYHHQVRMYVLDVYKDLLQRRLAGDEAVARRVGQAVGAQLQLAGALFARYVEDALFGHA